jgi:hypothetical protein
MDKSSLEALIRWLEIWSAIFGVIVVVGVAGESFFGIRLLWNNWKLQRIQGAEADALRGDVAGANERAADANARAKDAEARVAEATVKVEQERTARLKLQAKIADRRLTDEQRHRIQDALSAHPAYAVTVVSRLTDTEGKIYGADFIDALKAAGWNALWDIDWLRDTENVSIATVSGVKGPEVDLLDAALTAAQVPHGFVSIEPPDIHAIGGTGFQSGATYLLIGRHKP